MSREKAIELLFQAVCPKCDNYHISGRICKAKDNDTDYQVEWEDCQWCKERSKVIELLESEPAGEFTKKYPATFKEGWKTDNEGFVKFAREYVKTVDPQCPFVLEACDRIDRLEAELKAKDELLKKSRDFIRTQNHVGKEQMRFIKEIEQAIQGSTDG